MKKPKQLPPEPEVVIKKKKKKAKVIEQELPAKKKKKKKRPKPTTDGIPPSPPIIIETEAQRYQREIREEQERESRNKRSLLVLQNLNRRGLVKECLLRGLPFNMVPDSSPKLAGWLTDNLDMGQDQNRLVEYDAYLKQALIAKGNKDVECFTHPDLRFGIGLNSEHWDSKEVKKTIKKPTEEKPKPEPKEKRTKDDDLGICTGTKKHMAYTLALEGKAIDKIIRLITKAHPDTNEKSVRIWVKRALKENQQ